MKSIDVFQRIDGVQNDRLVDLPGQRQLHQDSMHFGIGVELCHQFEELRLGRLRRQRLLRSGHPGLFTPFALAAHINSARRIISDEHDRQVRSHSSFLLEGGDIAGQNSSQFL